MSLSDKLTTLHDLKKREQGFGIKVGDIKEFIKELKKGRDIKLKEGEKMKSIDELVGEKLI